MAFQLNDIVQHVSYPGIFIRLVDRVCNMDMFKAVSLFSGETLWVLESMLVPVVAPQLSDVLKNSPHLIAVPNRYCLCAGEYDQLVCIESGV